MYKIEKYTGNKTYMAPSGAIYDKTNVLHDFPAALTFVHVVTTDENSEVMFALQNLSAMRTQYNIDSSLSEADAIAAIQDAMNAPAPEPEESEASAEDITASSLASIAASLEYQNLLTLDDSTTTDKEDN